MGTVIRVQNLSKTYKVYQKEEGVWGSIKGLFSRKYELIPAVKNINFEIEEGEFVGFIGPNGAGKTTTIKILSGIIHPDEGDVQVLGFIPQKLDNGFKKNFSMVMGQKNQLWWDIPAIDSYQLFKEIYQIPEEQYRKNIAELAELFNVKHVLNVPVRKVSLGERMKLEIIGALLHQPKVLFLDEPTIGLDVFSRRAVRDFLKYINKERQTTIILTSHYIEDIKTLCPRIIAIQKGGIIYDGPFNQISQELIDVKQVSVNFGSPQSQLEQFGQVPEQSETSATFIVNKNSLKTFVAKIFENEEVIDLNIEDVPVDEIFEKLFNLSERVSK